MDEFIIPPGGFKSFNEFFTRNIKPGARPIAAVADDSVVVAPADCLINVIDSWVTADTKIPVKGRMKLNVKELLNNSEYADLFVGGTVVSCILLPSTYHHYHAPVSGMVVQSEENVHDLYYGIEDFPGFYHQGNIGHDADFSIFEQFHHGYYVIRTEKYGHVAMIPVGLNTISSVVFPAKYKEVKPQKPVAVHKGDDLGFFAYGGSLVILLFEKDRFPALKIPQGQRIGILNEKPSNE
ncbi:MAG: phosphatidylserine decarboxylase [Deltaproteobacteria bacterium]|nr:phosphatidylserine decarboxylase [Deltaproteobacteria bacterium]